MVLVQCCCLVLSVRERGESPEKIRVPSAAARKVRRFHLRWAEHVLQYSKAIKTKPIFSLCPISLSPLPIAFPTCHFNLLRKSIVTLNQSNCQIILSSQSHTHTNEHEAYSPFFLPRPVAVCGLLRFVVNFKCCVQFRSRGKHAQHPLQQQVRLCG